MDSWTLQGDSYSLLHNAPCTPFSLRHRDGTPNHVEIFDIIRSPSQRTAISETTCLCDIFGDECESPSASSNPAVGSVVHSQTEVERITVVSPLVDDLNDSSGSYHTAPGSTEGEEGFDDLTERIYSPELQGESTKCEQLEQIIVNSELCSSNIELKSKASIPQSNTEGPLSESDNTDFRERTSSPEHNSSSNFCSQEISFLCYSSDETTLLNPECEQERLTPILKDTRYNSLSHQSLTHGPSCEPMNCMTSSSESINVQSQLKETELQPSTTHFEKNISSSPGPTPIDFATQSSNVESRDDLSSHFPSSGCTESCLGEAILSSDLNCGSSLSETQASSPLNDLRGRVSLPDLLSRGSTPDVEIENSPHNSEWTEDLSTTEIDYKSSQFDTDIPTASPKYIHPVISVSPSPVDSGVVPELKHPSPSPDRLPTTRQPQEHQSRLKPASQRDKSGGPSRRPQKPEIQNKFSPRSVTNRPGRSSSSSMGSELDEADNEVKWLTDVAFRSLSSPEVDYLDIYNSSHRSSTNISLPSTEESPAGISGAWATYADFRGSSSKLDSDDLSFQQQPLYHSDGIDPARCYEMGSFECIDVAVEREDTRNVRRGVPKRQIQLKRKESVDDGSEYTSPGLPAMENRPPLERHSRETLLRQYSTPAAGHESDGPEQRPGPERDETKAKLKKSISLDEMCSKTKMATCLIKGVLSKKMQSADKQLHDPDGDEVNASSRENLTVEETHEWDKLNTSQYSNDRYPWEDFAKREEQSQSDDVKPAKDFGEKSNRPSSNRRIKISNLSRIDNQLWGSQDCNTSAASEMKSKLRVPFDSLQSSGGIQHLDDSTTWQGGEDGDSANIIAGNTGPPSATRALSTKTRMTSQHQECENTEVHKQLQQGDKSCHMTQEIVPQGGKKKKTSLNVCLTPEAEKNRDIFFQDMSFKQKEEKVKEAKVDLQSAEQNESEDNKVKGPIHKVRDVRRLVKNTYNLSFKATSCVSPTELCEERTNKCMVERKEGTKVDGKDEKLSTLPSQLQTQGKPLSQLHPMQIQCKAVCWKDDKNKIQSHKDTSYHYGKTLSSTNTDQDENSCKEDTQSGMQEPPATGATTKMQQHDFDEAESFKADSEERSFLGRTNTKPPMLGTLPKLPSKEREVSTAVVLIRDGSNQAKTCAPLIQEEVPTILQAASSPEITTTGSTPSSSSHSVSMLLKEKGYQADIGAVVGDSQNRTGGKGIPHKHVNCLEIPLQTPSDDGAEPNRETIFSASSTVPSPLFLSDSVDKSPMTRDKDGGCIKEKTITPQGNPPDEPNKHKEHKDFEVVKRQGPTFPPRSPAIRRFRPQPIESQTFTEQNNDDSAKCHKPDGIIIKHGGYQKAAAAAPMDSACEIGTCYNCNISSSGCPPHPARPPPAPHHHHSPHNLTPPAPPHSPGHVLPYQASQPLARPHQCRPDPQSMSFQPSSSPKSSPLSASHPPTIYQPLHQAPPCPPHPSLMPVDRTMPTDFCRLPPHRSPQEQPPSMPAAPYSDPRHGHSPALAPMEHQYMCGQYGSEYGGDTSSLYSESSYGQTPRRVLLDPETGKYFYIELPMQPLRKMLFDPETGQYVEVLIPQQGMSHSGLYPPSAAPYTSLHNPNMYGPAPQYMPFAHPQAHHQPPRYPEALSAAAMHPNGPGGSYRNCSGQGSKPDAPNHPPLDQNYLESMYYVPTGLNAGSNPTPPVYYHKHPPSLPPSAGKRS
ncbi:uncharacterized protein C4orf54 [Syngnathoides biaculeatus]|uniref:uncharacterized protein C4orf54 n=1 Tax=Syngnathoides biaculeatus TaxID=300417 RepID=UPI002ADE4FAA|nr:uncharacterized protein C4orf54 [Syngnathoides biaculeatus]